MVVGRSAGYWSGGDLFGARGVESARGSVWVVILPVWLSAGWSVQGSWLSLFSCFLRFPLYTLGQFCAALGSDRFGCLESMNDDDTYHPVLFIFLVLLGLEPEQLCYAATRMTFRPGG